MTNPKQRIKLLNPVHFLATGFGSGLSPFMPGTVGTLAAVPVYLILINLSFSALVAAIVLGSILGIYLCDRTSKDMGAHDHGSIVWDEFVGFWITMLFVPTTNGLTVFIGFVLFRLFDIIKPWPISWLDKKVHGGIGIMLDDILAGIFAALSLWLITHYLL